MRILYAVPYAIWPAVGGARTRSAHLVAGLASAHEVHVFALQGPDDPRQAAGAHPDCASVELFRLRGLNPPRFSPDWTLLRLRSLAVPAPAYFRRDARAAFAVCARRVDPAMLVLGFSWMLPYAAHATGVPAVADEHNYDPLIAERMAEAARGPARLKWRVYAQLGRRAERRALRRVRAVAAVSPEEAALFRRLAPHADVAVVPNGVDTRAIRPSPPGRAVVMTGSMSYTPNRLAAEWLVTEIWPAVRRAAPSAELRLVGWQGETALAHLRGRPGVTVVGSVPDIRPELGTAAVLVAPLKVGAGTRIKILEAFAAGRPVVSTTVGVEGLGVRDGEECFIRDAAEGFAEAVVKLLGDAGLAAAMGARGRALVERVYTWEHSGAVFRELCERTAARRRA